MMYRILNRASDNQRGFSTILMVSIVMVAAVALTLSGYVLSNNMTDQVSGKKEFEMDRAIANGLNQYLLRIAQEYYRYTVTPTLTELESIVSTRLMERLALEKDANGNELYKMANFKIEQTATMDQSLVVNSVFTGMMAPQTIFNASYQVLKPSAYLGGGDIKVNVEQLFSVSQVGMFKFVTLGTINDYVNKGSPYTAVKGRVHVNYDFCVGNDITWQPQYYDRVTAAGGIYHYGSPECGGPAPLVHNLFVSFVDKFAPGPMGGAVPLDKFKQVLPGVVHGCKDCEGSGKDWAEYALEYWKGHLVDSAHDVPVLTLPASQVAQVQAGQWGKVTNSSEDIKGASNHPTPGCAPDQQCSPEGNIRLYVDPVRATDSKEIRLSKISYTSDLRIIDGVWYIRDKSDNDNWPGIPIWSDHPGDYDQDGKPVGQNWIRNSLAGKPQQWALDRVPQRFSIYRFEKQGAGGWAITDTNSFGVVSYGALKKVAATASDQPWEPAHYVESPTEGKWLCNAKGGTANVLQTPCSGGKCGFVGTMSGGLKCQPSAGGAAFGMPVSTQFLNATRSGFQLPSARYGTKPGPGLTQAGCANPTEDDTRQARARMMPMNINMRAFYEALADTTPGELGSYFDGGNTFNGQVYIANRWANDNTANSLIEGFSADPSNSTLVQEWAFHGSFSDTSQIPPTSPEAQESLPYPLCSTSLAGQNFDTQGAFKIPNCATYKPGSGTNYNYINMVRLYNAKQLDGIDPAKGRILSKGLSIASSQAITMLGSWNAESAPANVDDNTAAYEPWLPTMVAGDRMTYHSNGWTDENARWSFTDQLPIYFCNASSKVMNPNYVSRKAEDTRYVLGRMGANTEADEAWSGIRMEFIGSASHAYFPVYHRSEFVATNFHPNAVWNYTPMIRIYAYDPHLDYVQPPGVPSFSIVSSIRQKIK